MKKLYYFLIVSLLIISCNDKCKDELKMPDNKLPLNIIRSEKELYEMRSAEVAHSWIKKYPEIADNFFQKNAFPHDSLLANYLYKFYSNKELKYLFNATDSAFSKPEDLKLPLENFLLHVSYYYPKFIRPRVYTLVSGFQFEKDMAITDTAIVISLDYFLGKKAKYRPPFYSYFLERYEKQYITPMISLAVSNKFNEVDLKDETMLANMIFYGKAYYFSKAMQPCISDSLIVQYSGQQLKDIHDNEDIIWGHFIQNKLLFETKPQIIEKYVGESPKINEIGEKCPGRIGRWLGWEIVKKYAMQHPELSLQEIMKEKNAQKIFNEAKYKPQEK